MWSSERERQKKNAGNYFSYRQNKIHEFNVFPKLKEFENYLKSWKHRKLILMDKLALLKRL